MGAGSLASLVQIRMPPSDHTSWRSASGGAGIGYGGTRGSIATGATDTGAAGIGGPVGRLFANISGEVEDSPLVVEGETGGGRVDWKDSGLG